MPSNLFAPGKIGSLELPNRLIRSATQDPFAQRDGSACQPQVELYRAIAATGPAMIINGYAYVSQDGRSSLDQVGFCTQEHYDSEKQVLDAIHEAGSKFILQINHSGLNVFTPPEKVDYPLLAPTGGVKGGNGELSQEITLADMDRIQQDFVTAAVKAKELGFDGVQLHCAHSYLLSQFLDPNYNQRTDEYGGSAENNFRYTRRILAALREALGKDYPLLVKVNTNCAGEADEGYEALLLDYCRFFQDCGVDAIELSGFDWIPQGKKKNHNFYLERAKKVRAVVDVPLILVGGIRTQADIQAAMDAGMDYVSMCRPFICQPNLLEHLKNGEDSPCVSCSKCFNLWRKEGRRCITHEVPTQA